MSCCKRDLWTIRGFKQLSVTGSIILRTYNVQTPRLLQRTRATLPGAVVQHRSPECKRAGFHSPRYPRVLRLP